MSNDDQRFRSEHDLLGDRDVPADAYWGVHTLRAIENFPITGQRLSSNPDLVRGLAAVKLAAARTNRELGLLDAERAGAIEQACQDILDGKLHEQFMVDVRSARRKSDASWEEDLILEHYLLSLKDYQ